MSWLAPSGVMVWCGNRHRPGRTGLRLLDASLWRGWRVRKMAIASTPDAEFRRAMIYDPEDGSGVFVFLFRSLDDGPCQADDWYEDVAGAERHAADELGVKAADRQPVPDPQPGCRHDWLAPVRVARDADGRPV
jgi:hypothetical protein